MHDRKDMPANTIGCQKVTKESCNISQSVRLVSMYSIVIFGKRLLEKVGPQSIELGETLSNKTEEL